MIGDSNDTIRKVEVVSVIRIEYLAGHGIESSPVRLVVQFRSMTGELLAVQDSWAEEEARTCRVSEPENRPGKAGIDLPGPETRADLDPGLQGAKATVPEGDRPDPLRMSDVEKVFNLYATRFLRNVPLDNSPEASAVLNGAIHGWNGDDRPTQDPECLGWEVGRTLRAERDNGGA